jgi:hypothetical protein
MAASFFARTAIPSISVTLSASPTTSLKANKKRI